MTFGRLYIDMWLIPLFFLFCIFFYISLRVGQDTTLLLLIDIDKKTNEIQESNNKIIEILER